MATSIKASYSPSVIGSHFPLSLLTITLVLMRSKDLCPLPPHLEHYTLLLLVETLDELAEEAGCIEVVRRLWGVICFICVLALGGVLTEMILETK
jgi:hypothetical protein